MVEASPVTLHPAFVEVLSTERESFNQRYALLQRAGARVDDAAFQLHLRSTVNQLVSDVASAMPERVRAVVSALFDASLELFAGGLLGPEPKHPYVATAWQEVLPATTKLLARDPLMIVGSLSNAVDHLAAHTSARPVEWIQLMRDVSPRCESVSEWLDAGKVIAWRAGLVQYRSAALKLARQLPSKLAKCCIGVPSDISGSDWQSCLDRLETDRWFSPFNGNQEKQSLSIVRTTGEFRGFGGLCLRPPTVQAANSSLFVSDGTATWQLLADAFGTLWHRVPAVPKSAATSGSSKVGIDTDGKVTWDRMHRTFNELAEPGSYACDGQTMAVTLPTSHHVFLVARATP